METVRYFTTFEERELRFRQDVHSLFPRKHAGPAVFWKDMTVAISDISSVQSDHIAYISSNPQDCLAYNFVDDLLNATKLLLPKQLREILFEEVVQKYGITPIFGQQIHTLSGGEVVRLALAKNDLLSTIVDKVIVSSPLAWLSSSNSILYAKFLNTFAKKSKIVSVLAMEGENSKEKAIVSIDNTLDSELILNDLKIKLSSNELESDSQETWATVANTKLHFKSPCLLTGDNGSGKSLLARSLSGAIHCTGHAKIKTNGYFGKSRLLFQDVIMQTMLRPFSVLLLSDKCVSAADVRKDYKKLVSLFVQYFKLKDHPIPFIGDTASRTKTLLEYKFLLVAIRLCSRPTALILDEPDWGLTRETAIGFVKATIDIAHEYGTSIIIISHKKWWDEMAKTHLEASKQFINEDRIKYIFFLRNISNNERHVS